MNGAMPSVIPSNVRPADHPAVASGRIGVLLVNLGTPDAANAASVRRYLREFLSDARVIENNGLLWKVILNGFILQVRPARKARDYEKIWNWDRNESPLKTITRAQADKLGAALAPHDRGRGPFSRCLTARSRLRQGYSS